MEIGDLICFNAAGQRSKTLGVIVDRYVRTYNWTAETYYHIHWAKRGEVMPFEEWGSPKDSNFHRYLDKGAIPRVHPGTFNKKGWYKAGSWLEVIKKQNGHFMSST